MKVVQELVAYFDRRGKLTRKQIRHLLDQGLLAAEAPLTMIDLCDPVGATYYFRVTGESAGPLWGTEVYTGDSAIAVAAVHAGVVKAGAASIVKITVEKPLPRYAASTQHGVTSHEFGQFGTAYRISGI